jgi:hypothetical protein
MKESPAEANKAMMRDSSATAGWRLRTVTRLSLALFISLATPTILLGQARLASRFGEANVGGQRVIVHVTVAVPQGADANALADDAVRGQGARPFRPSEFSVTGLIWDQFLDGIPGNDVVNQYYNPSGEPTAFSAISSLQSSQRTWTGVATSLFSFDDAGPTSRCPSLVKECPGAQVFDGFNDVGWMNIGGCCTLAVTWSGTSTDEADMALNSRFSWTNTDGDFDVETVMLHENGHVVGLGHSSVGGSVMEAVYAGMRRALTTDDERGATYLYPEAGAVGMIRGSVTSGGNPVRRARVRISDLPISATTDDSGHYVLDNVPDIGAYSVTASAGGYDSQTFSEVQVGETVHFVLPGKGGS